MSGDDLDVAKCDPLTGFHVVLPDAERCECGERARMIRPKIECEDTGEEIPMPLLAPVRENNVIGCARCGEDHALRFTEFARPLETPGGVVFTHWAACPSTGDPILMRFARSYGADQPPLDLPDLIPSQPSR